MNAMTRPADPPQEIDLGRFDEGWTGYDEADLDAFASVLRQVGFRPAEVNMRWDDAGIFFARALDYVKATVYGVSRPNPAVDRLVVTTQDTPAWAESVTWQIYDEVGMAKIIANYSDDLPRADVRARETSTRVHTIGDSYGYNTQEMRAAAQARSNLPVRRGVAARSAIERKHNSLRVRGDTTFGMYGLVNHPNIPTVAPVTGNHATTATGDQIVTDVSALLNAIINQSNGVHVPNVLGVDTQRRQAWSTKRTSATATSEYAIDVIQRLFPSVEIVTVQELKGAGSGATNVLFAAERAAENYWYDLPMGLVQHPPQARNLEFVVPCESRTAGIIVARPLSMAVMSGV